VHGLAKIGQQLIGGRDDAGGDNGEEEEGER